LASIKSVREDSPLKKLRIMVIIPEYHIQRPIPDPAGETEVTRAFIAEGFRMVDQKQVETIRQKDFVKRAMKDDPKELLAIAQSWGAELLVVGEAFSQEVQGLGDGQAVCRARIEAKILLCDTGEILASNDAAAGSSDLASAVAAKAAIREAAKVLAGKLIDDLLVKKTATGAQSRIRVILAGADFEKKLQFEELLGSFKETVSSVEEISYLDSRAEMDVVTTITSGELAKAVFLGSKKQGVALKVAEQSSRRCVFEVAATPDPAAK
jgi:hypothetical protein